MRPYNFNIFYQAVKQAPILQTQYELPVGSANHRKQFQLMTSNFKSIDVLQPATSNHPNDINHPTSMAVIVRLLSSKA